MRRRMFFGVAVTAALLHGSAWAQLAAPADVALTPTVRLVFASADEGRALADARDDYSERTGALERQLKVRTTRALSEAEYLHELAADVREWSSTERERMARVIESLREPLARLPLPLPPRVVLVLMAGRVNGPMVAYTRGPAIYLPRAIVSADNPPGALAYLLSHELFHVASRQDRAWRDAMYAAIGFLPLPEVTLPPTLQARRMTNPDAPRLDSAIRVMVAERGTAWVVPLLQATIDRIDKEPPAHFMQVMTLRWLEVGRGEAAPAKPVVGEPPQLYDTRDLSGFFEAIGRNTPYIIHAEEIVADNFSQLVLGRAPQSPEIHARMREVMTARAAATAAPASRAAR